MMLPLPTTAELARLRKVLVDLDDDTFRRLARFTLISEGNVAALPIAAARLLADALNERLPRTEAKVRALRAFEQAETHGRR
ncbi:MAG TPA: hypothetical protein VN667_09205 [Burkholderiales bacterium]|nr:hypothetical protein [Burkholderiales bacterium]